MRNHVSAALGILFAFASTGAGDANARAKDRAAHWNAHRHVVSNSPSHRRRVDVGRRGQAGKASVYAESFRGRRMADGTPFNPKSNAAASNTLPLGTTAHVTNLKNGRTATVRVRDRGPHRAGRIIDISPGSADALGMSRNSITLVAIVPLKRQSAD